jgi:hypothetical protein
VSRHIARIIPCDPLYVPGPDAIEAAVKHVRGVMRWEAEVNRYEQIQFIDQGENFEGIRCPFCGETLAIPWWQEAMDRGWDSAAGGFTDLTCTVPCCGRTTSLNSLQYEMPAGFARFELSLENAYLESADLAPLEEILGCTLRVVYAMY